MVEVDDLFGITDGKMTIREPMMLQEGQTVHDVMRNVAEVLPENERGFYR